MKSGKPALPRGLEDALEEYGPETIRTVLLHGWANPQGMPQVLKQIGNPSQERAHALAWLKWKDARQSHLGKINLITTAINLIATTVAAVAAVLAAIFAYMALR